MHHFALLGGYGAEAIYPYLALETLGQLGDIVPQISGHESEKRFIKAICKGTLQVMSKMGISTYQATAARDLRIVGLNSAFLDKYFTGTPSTVEGIGIFEVAEEQMRTHRAAFGNDPVLARRAGCGR